MQEVFTRIIEKLEKSKPLITVEDAIKIVNQVTAEYNNGWIPCSERLPEERVNVLATFSNHGPVVAWYSKVNKQWRNSSTDNVIKVEVTAWQPLPEPYQLKDNIEADYRKHNVTWEQVPYKFECANPASKEVIDELHKKLRKI